MNLTLVVKLAWHLIVTAPVPSSIYSLLKPVAFIFSFLLLPYYSAFSEIPFENNKTTENLSPSSPPSSHCAISFSPLYHVFEPSILLSPFHSPQALPSCCSPASPHISEILLPKDTHDIEIAFSSIPFNL